MLQILPEFFWNCAEFFLNFYQMFSGLSQNAAIFKSCWRLKLNDCKLVKIQILRTFNFRFEQHLIFIYTNILFSIKFSSSSLSQEQHCRMNNCADSSPVVRRRRASCPFITSSKRVLYTISLCSSVFVHSEWSLPFSARKWPSSLRHFLVACGGHNSPHLWPSNEDFEKIIISTLGLCDNLRKYTFVENIF